MAHQPQSGNDGLIRDLAILVIEFALLGPFFLVAEVEFAMIYVVIFGVLSGLVIYNFLKIQQLQISNSLVKLIPILSLSILFMMALFTIRFINLGLFPGRKRVEVSVEQKIDQVEQKLEQIEYKVDYYLERFVEQITELFAPISMVSDTPTPSITPTLSPADMLPLFTITPFTPTPAPTLANGTATPPPPTIIQPLPSVFVPAVDFMTSTPTPTPILEFWAEGTTLYWHIERVKEAYLSGGELNNLGVAGPFGSRSVSPNIATTYFLVVQLTNGEQKTLSITLDVLPTPTVLPTLPSIPSSTPTSTPSPTSTSTNTPTPTATSTQTVITPQPTETNTSTPTNTPLPSPTATATSTPTETPTPLCLGYAQYILSEQGVSSAEDSLCQPDNNKAKIGVEGNSVLILDMGQGNEIVDNQGGDFYFYEFLNEGGIYMDQTEVAVALDRGDGQPGEFITVFTWGDNSITNNGLIPPDYLPEIANRFIPTSDLHNKNGIGIDIGNGDGQRYRFVRFRPLHPVDDEMLFVDVDAIEISSFDMPSPSTPEPTAQPTPEATKAPTVTMTPKPTEEATVEPTQEATIQPTPEPTAEVTPTTQLTPEPTQEPTATVTPEPTEEPTVEPTEEVTTTPTPEPTEEATVEPTQEPTATVTPEPTEKLDKDLLD